MLKINDLHFDVEDKQTDKEILNGISLTFENNKIYVITGPNGSGKSTLVKAMMGIIKPSKGSVNFNGKDVTNLPINQRAKLGFCYAFQQPVTFKGLKVKDLLDVATNKSNDHKTMCDFLSVVGLCAKDYINRNLDDKLSGGELKRIELAMALARKAKVNIFDEPEAGIDLWSFDNLTQIFKNLKGINIIVSHQAKILEIADEVILLNGGKVERIGSYNEIKPYLRLSCKKLEGGNE